MSASPHRPDWTLLRLRLAGWSLLLVCLWTDPGNVRANWEFVSALSTFELRHQVLARPGNVSRPGTSYCKT